MPASLADPTAALTAPAGPATATVVAHPASDGFDPELRPLLRSRLVVVHLLALLYVALLGVLSAAVLDGDPLMRPDQGTPWRLLPPLAQCAVGALALWRSPAMTVRSLRRWELVHFATTVGFYGELRFEMLAYTAPTAAPEAARYVIPFFAAATLFGFTALILAYGVLIPNTRRRSLLGVGAITAVPFAAIAAAAAFNPTLWGEHGIAITAQAAANLAFPAALAVFVAARTTTLQRRAFEAERRAEQVGQYALQRKLGEGGMGEVWLAEHRLLKRPCAVKFVRPELAAHPATAARFAREVQAVTGLTHPNTVRVYDYGRAGDGSFYYVMEHLDGPTLDQLVGGHGPLPPGRAVHLVRQLCGALAEAHAAGLVHRDLKPGNVIVARLGGVCDVAKLLDFGLVLDGSGADDRLTRAGVVLGTPAYMTPEQASGEPVDARGDVYSLGAVLHFALTGRPPFAGRSAGQVMAAHRTAPPPSPAGAPPDLATVMVRCLAKDPAERYQTVDHLDAALAGCGCAADWSTRRAAAWWAGVSGASAAPPPPGVSTVPRG